jgi:selenide,water dikinase
VLGWPLEKLPAEVAGQVVAGARSICAEAGITLAGGHSIDSPEPVFGLAVTGLVSRANLRTNGGAKPGDLLFLTKPLGVGILATAEKKGKLKPEDTGKAAASMSRLNRIGTELATLPGVHALTDVTGFGLLGHLREMCEASGVTADLDFACIPQIANLEAYLAQQCSPGGARRNWESYGDRVEANEENRRLILCDPQTSGGLLAAVDPEAAPELIRLLERHGLANHATPIGRLSETTDGRILIRVRD